MTALFLTNLALLYLVEVCDNNNQCIIAWYNGYNKHIVSGPQALQNSVSPVGRFVPTSSTTWSITFDQAVSC